MKIKLGMNINIFCLFASIFSTLQRCSCTIDVNLSELEYLAAHLDIFQCRRLIAALHYNSWHLPSSIDGAERKVDEDLSCLRQLLHWNSSPDEGLGKSHEHLEHRLRQIGRQDLANWFGKTVFKKLGKDIEKSLKKPFGELGEVESESQFPITLEPAAADIEENPWTWLDTVLMASLMAASACLLLVVLALIFHKLKSIFYGKPRGRRKQIDSLKEEEEKLLNSDSD